MKYAISGIGELNLTNIVLDLNGTLAVKGSLVEGVASRIQQLEKQGFRIVLLTGDQRGNAHSLCQDLGIELIIATTSEEKRRLMQQFPKANTVAIGNARIDIGTFQNAALAIATLQAEGIHTQVLQYADILVPSINDALDLILDPNTLAATMRL